MPTKPDENRDINTSKELLIEDIESNVEFYRELIQEQQEQM